MGGSLLYKSMIKTLIALLLVLGIKASGLPRYDEVSWLCTHNSYNASNSGFRFANHTLSIKEQLDTGVRAFMLDVHLVDKKIVLSHGSKGLSFIGSTPLEAELKVYHDFLTKNPEAIVTLIFESYVPAKDVAGVISATGLEKFAHSQDASKPWPSLAALRQSGKRLIIFSDRVKGKGSPAWYHDVWAHCTETHWSNKTPVDLMVNRSGRGDKENPLFIQNHFLQNPLASPSLAKTVNKLAFFKKRHLEFQKAYPKRRPNFITIDFSSIGDGLAFVDFLNAK